MDHKEFDKTIKKELKNELYNWDKDAMWQAIENELPEKDSNRPFAFWATGGILLLLVTAFYFLIQINHKVDSIIELQTNDISSESASSSTTTQKDKIPISELNNQPVFNEQIQKPESLIPNNKKNHFRKGK